jgi:predicted CXXCH cytochrome family protein
MRSLIKKALIIAGGFLLFAGTPAFAQDKPAAPISAEQLAKNHKANDECFACHSTEGLKHPPVKGIDQSKLRGLLQEPEAFYNSDHQRLVCTKCHNDGYDDYPHAPDAKDSTTTCSDCHSKKADRIEPQFQKSVHADLADKFTCTTCHNPHLMRVAEKLSDPHKIVAQDNRVCLSCHDSDEKFAKFAPEKKSRPPIDEIHEWLPNTRLHWTAVRCVECHTPAVAAGEMISHQILNKEKAERNCVACHSANSTLKSRLYRHLVGAEEQRLGFANSVILANTYVLGATRNPFIDTLVVIAFCAMLIGLVAHGVGRIIAHIIVSRRNKNG